MIKKGMLVRLLTGTKKFKSHHYGIVLCETEPVIKTTAWFWHRKQPGKKKWDIIMSHSYSDKAIYSIRESDLEEL